MDTNGIASILRRERLAKGLTVDDIHASTRIAPRFIEAIEANEFERLPGLIFARNFVRQYSQTLGLDPTELLAAIPSVEESSLKLPDAPMAPKPRTLFLKSHWDARNNSALSSIAWLCIAAVAGGGGYLYFNRSEPAHAAQPAPATRVKTKPQTTPEAKPATAQADNSPAASPRKAASVQVVIRARQPSWISLSADGRHAFTGTLAADEVKEFSALDQVRLLTGNAGGLSVSLNGKPLDSLGPAGQVREIRLTAEGPEFLSTAHPPPADDAL